MGLLTINTAIAIMIALLICGFLFFGLTTMLVPDPCSPLRRFRKTGLTLIFIAVLGLTAIRIFSWVNDGNMYIGSLSEYETVTMEILQTDGNDFTDRNIEIQKAPILSVNTKTILIGDDSYSLAVTNVSANDIKKAGSKDTKTVTVRGIYTGDSIRAVYEHKSTPDSANSSIIILACLLPALMISLTTVRG